MVYVNRVAQTNTLMAKSANFVLPIANNANGTKIVINVFKILSIIMVIVKSVKMENTLQIHKQYQYVKTVLKLVRLVLHLNCASHVIVILH